MRGSRKTSLAAAVGFLLIAILLIGGMTWATLATAIQLPSSRLNASSSLAARRHHPTGSPRTSYRLT